MKRVVVALCFAVLAVGLARAAEAKPTIAVLGLEVVDEGGGIDEKSTKMAKELTDALRQRAKVGTGPYSLAPGSDKDLLEMKLLSGCDSEADDCMASIGKELSSERLLYGKVQKRQGGYQVSLKLLNVSTKKNEKSSSDLIPVSESSGADLTRWGKTFYNRLTGATDQGTLVIKANVDRGIVYLDGAVKGNLVGGAARITGLAEGAYRLAVEAEGHVRYEARVTVTGGQDSNHQADLKTNALAGETGSTVVGSGGDRNEVSGTVSSEERPGGGSRALFWASLALTAGSATAMTITGLQVRGSLVDEKNEAIRQWQKDNEGKTDLQGPDACSKAKTVMATAVVDACDKGESRALITNVLIGTTVVGAAATVLFYYKGYVAPRSHTESSATASRNRRNRKPVVSLTPTVSPTTLGGLVRIDF